MNFFFGQISCASSTDLKTDLEGWLKNTIFSSLKDNISTFTQQGFSLVLINDPKNICAQQSSKIHVDEQYVCTSDCILYNKKALAAQLGIDTLSSNEQFIISAFKQWGRLFADQLDGKFSFILWDRQENKLLAARDALGYGNFCYSQHQDSLYFSSDLATLLDHPRVDKTINNKRFYQCFRYSNNPPGQTYFKHCHYCPPSHILEFDGTVSQTDYWGLGSRPAKTPALDEDTNCKTYLSLISDAIENEYIDTTTTGLMLSGGFDSSLLAAICADNAPLKQSLTCYSYVFNNHKSCDESAIINQTVSKFELQSNQINADDLYVFSALDERTVFKDMINLDGYAALPEAIFKQASADSKNLLILGHFGDDLFAGNQYKFADLIANRDIKTIAAFILKSDHRFKALLELTNFGIRPLLPESLKNLYRRINKPKTNHNDFNISDDQINNVDDELKQSTGKLFHHQNLLKLLYFSNTAEGIYFYRKHLYLEHGLKYVMPYYSKKMVEFFWHLPISQLNKPGCYRWLQRQSLRLKDLPEIASSNHKTEFIELFATGITRNRTQITQVLENCRLKSEIDLPGHLLQKLKSNADIDNLEAGIISQYVLTALWWQAINDSDASFNQPNKMDIHATSMDCRIKPYGLRKD